MAEGTRLLRGGSPASSPLLGGRGRAAAVAAAAGSSPPGHGFRRVTLTKPTFCHYCTDFIWGLAGYQCEGKGVQVGAGRRAAGRAAGRPAAGSGAGPGVGCAAGPAGNGRRVLGEMGRGGGGEGKPKTFLEKLLLLLLNNNIL